MKTTEEIYGEMLSLYEEKTGMSLTGESDLSVRLYAAAAQAAALYAQCEWMGKQCFPQTAAGQYLDSHAQLRGLQRKSAAAAEGEIQFYVDKAAAADLPIAAGTVCMTAGCVRFETTRAAVLPAGSTSVSVPARALEAGTAGNAGAGTVLTMAVAPVGISRCGNSAAFSGGEDEETDETLRARVLASYRRLPNGANAAYYEQQALSFGEVAAAAAIPRSRGIGTVDVVVSVPGGIPESALLQKLTDYFSRQREIAVDVQVLAPTAVPVNVSIKLVVEDNRDFDTVSAAVKSAVISWFDGKLLGQNVLLARLGNLIYSVDGVRNYALTAPAADVAAAAGELPQLGTLTVEAMT